MHTRTHCTIGFKGEGVPDLAEAGCQLQHHWQMGGQSCPPASEMLWVGHLNGWSFELLEQEGSSLHQTGDTIPGAVGQLPDDQQGNERDDTDGDRADCQQHASSLIG